MPYRIGGVWRLALRIRGSVVRTTALIAVSTLILADANQAAGALITYEGFDYPAGTDNLGGKNGGTGWGVGSSWSSTGGAGNPIEEVRTPGSTYSVLETIGNRAWISGGPRIGTTNGAVGASFRSLPSKIGTGDETVWLSFIGTRDGTNLIRFFGLGFFEDGTASANERFTIGENSLNSNDAWGMHFLSTGSDRQDVAGAPITAESFILARIDYHSAGNDDIYLWVNYDITQDRPAKSTAQASLVGGRNLAFDRLGLRAGSGNTDGPNAMASYDEIRIGETYRDVTVAPEPVSAAFAVSCAAALALVRRRGTRHLNGRARGFGSNMINSRLRTQRTEQID